MWDEWSTDKVPLHAVLSYYAFSLMTVKTWPEGWRQQSEQTFLAIAQLGSRFYLLNTLMASKHDQRRKMRNALFIKTPFYMEAILCPNRESFYFFTQWVWQSSYKAYIWVVRATYPVPPFLWYPSWKSCHSFEGIVPLWGRKSTQFNWFINENTQNYNFYMLTLLKEKAIQSHSLYVHLLHRV